MWIELLPSDSIVDNVGTRLPVPSSDGHFSQGQDSLAIVWSTPSGFIPVIIPVL